jgi:adenine-specific DNA methylase
LKKLRDLRGGAPRDWNDPAELQSALLDFIADFADWDLATNDDYLKASRELVSAAQEVFGEPDSKPLVVDPFAGGGSIPLEALRVGADAFASDLNPVAVLLNKVMLEMVPEYGPKLAEAVSKWANWIQQEAKRELASCYPDLPHGLHPVAYLWARTITCEGPGCGAEVPLLRSLWLVQKGKRSVALRIIPNRKTMRPSFEIIENIKAKDVDEGTVRRSSATCPTCGYTTPAENVRNQFVSRGGGADDARFVAIVADAPRQGGKTFHLPRPEDFKGFELARRTLEAKRAKCPSVVPDEPLPYLRSIFNINLLGVDQWGKLFNPRQVLALVTLVEKTKLAEKLIEKEGHEAAFARAVSTCLALAIDRCADYWSSLAVWAGDFVAHTFGRQALGIIWDFAEVNGFADGSGNYLGAVEWIARCIEREGTAISHRGTATIASACNHPLPDDSVDAFITDPPYYDAVPYADLSDFFYVWLKRSIGNLYPELFTDELSPKNGEVVQLSERNPNYAYKTREYFQTLMQDAMTEGRRILRPGGVGVVVFAHKTTTGWETQLQAMVDSGWVVTGSWPIDTERPGRLRANNAAALASSVHLICRPRESAASSRSTQEIGDWRDVLQELPPRIHSWLPKLAAEGVVGADAIFACLGPALEIFSRYDRVEKASGDAVTLKEYLEYVWAAVAKEALGMVFKGADASGFEEDARLTAMWLWTLSAGQNGTEPSTNETAEEEESEAVTAVKGYALEFDAARKIAQGLGAQLESLTSLVEVKGETARLLPVAERTRRLFSKEDSENGAAPRRKKKAPQMQLGFISELEEAEDSGGWGSKGTPTAGATALDRVHQSMILFAAGRGEALRRFLVDEGVGRDERFWRLAQVLSYLYPSSSEERRWTDGVLARKKGLGF